MEEIKSTRPGFFGVQLKLLVLLFFVVLFFAVVTVTSLLGLYRIGQSSDIIVGRETPLVRSIQEALSAMVVGQSMTERALDIDNPKEVNKVDEQEEEFKNSTARFNMFMAAITWGSETEAFQRSSGGENYEAWTAAGLNGVIVVREAMTEQIELAGQTGMYYEGFVNNSQKAITLRKEFLNLTNEGKLNDAEKARTLSKESVLKARRFADLTIGNLRQMMEQSNAATLESVSSLKTIEGEVQRTTILTSFIGLLVSIIFCIIFARIFIIRPITNLRDAANTLAKGDYTARARVMSGDEMGQLAGSFNKMASSLELYATDLEKKIEQKTSELVEAKAHVEKAYESYKKITADTLSRLTPVLQRAAMGDFSVKIEIPEREDEFTELLVGLSIMTEDLRELEKTREKLEEEKIQATEEKRRIIEDYSKDLEKNVEEKTAELEQSRKAVLNLLEDSLGDKEKIDQAKIHIETIVENLTSGLVEYDSNFIILRINNAAEEMLGIQRGNVAGKQISPEDIANRELESLVRVSYPGLTPGVRKLKKEISGFSGADVHEIIVRYPLERELQVVTAPVTNPATGETYGFIKVIRDITRERMISKSKSEFISIAAHQLRTPLSGIKWTMKLIMDGDMGPLNHEQLEYLDRGYETAQKMVRLVNDLLNVARIEDGRFGYEFKMADIVETLSVTLNNSILAAKARNIEVEFIDNTGGVEPFVFDAEKISLAVQNLLDNAIKYTNLGGKVVFEIEKEGDYLKGKISDNGVGIPSAQMERLFSKFFRADNVMHMQTDGSGLGLFIVKNILLRHGGNITVESEEGKGTTFIFVIPLKEELIPKEEGLTYY